jgi:hypothetical protein
LARSTGYEAPHYADIYTEKRVMSYFVLYSVKYKKHTQMLERGRALFHRNAME